MSEVTVRVATPLDMSGIMEIAVEAAKENGFLNATKSLLARAVWGPINQDHGIIGCIGTPGELIEGFVCLNVGTVFYSDQPCLEERVVFVRPDYRSRKDARALKLINFSKRAADRLRLPLLIGVCSNERTAAKVKLYEREFGPPAGAYWLYQTSTGGHEVGA